MTHIISWLVTAIAGDIAYRIECWHRPAVVRGLRGKIEAAVKLYPCDLLVVHRDAERARPEDRRVEIEAASVAAQLEAPFAMAIPVHMTEAWLFSDEAAIRLAAGNPNGKQAVNIPRRDRWESLPDPKEILFAVIREATGLSAQRLAQFNVCRARSLVALHTSNFAGLVGTASFDSFRESFAAAIEQALVGGERGDGL